MWVYLAIWPRGYTLIQLPPPNFQYNIKTYPIILMYLSSQNVIFDLFKIIFVSTFRALRGPVILSNPTEM